MNDFSVVIPIYKENAKVVEDLYDELVERYGCEVIIVNDGDTVDLRRSIPDLSYYPNFGYGYALKKGIAAATSPIVITMDGDGQHSALDIWKLYTMYTMVKDCKMVIGCRWNLNERPVRWWARKIINFMASIVSGHYLLDLNSGMRIFDRQMAVNYAPILCDTFSFTTSLTMSMVTDGHKIAWMPIDVAERKHGKSHVRLFRDGLVTIFYIFWVGLALRTRRIRSWKRSLHGR